MVQWQGTLGSNPQYQTSELKASQPEPPDRCGLLTRVCLVLGSAPGASPLRCSPALASFLSWAIGMAATPGLFLFFFELDIFLMS